MSIANTSFGGDVFAGPIEDCLYFSVQAVFAFRSPHPKQNISHDQWYSSLKEVFAELGIDITKVTHAFRVGGARWLDECGVDDQVGAPGCWCMSC